MDPDKPVTIRTGEGYQAKPLTYIPLSTQMLGRQDVTVDYLSPTQYWQGYKLIQNAAIRADNVGIDEFPDPESYDELIEFGHCFTIKMSGNDGISALLIILPEFSSRTCDVAVAEIRVIMAEGVTNMLADVVSLGEKITIDLDLGYWACVVQVAIPCLEWTLALQKEGYVTTAILPKCVNMAGKGLVENCKMYKRLPVPIRQKRPDWMVRKTMEGFFKGYENFKQTKLKAFDILPLNFKFSSGLCAVLRNHTHDDSRMLYALSEEVTRDGQGFGTDEVPGYNFFLERYVAFDYACILEEETTKEFIGVIYMNDSWHSRTSQKVVGEVTTILHPKFRGQGIGTETTKIGGALAKELGFEYQLNDSVATNVQVQALVSRSKDIFFVGTLPFGAHVKGHGWVAIRFDFRSLANAKTFNEMGIVGPNLSSNISSKL